MLLDPHPFPPENFNQFKLPVTKERKTYYRLNPANFPSAIYFDRSGRGRFDSEESSYGICYLGETIEVCFIETFGRQLGVKFVSLEFIKTRNLFSICSERTLVLVDLFGAGLAKLGIDSRISSGGDYTVSRAWCEAIYNHPQQVDGIRYFSRHDNTRLCCGLFDRRKLKLKEQNLGNLIDCNTQKLAEILEIYEWGIA
ncbi:MAG: RES family NAD+ phosphorylase [Waterburya sp.]